MKGRERVKERRGRGSNSRGVVYCDVIFFGAAEKGRAAAAAGGGGGGAAGRAVRYNPPPRLSSPLTL